jgi:hypothetical protein
MGWGREGAVAGVLINLASREALERYCRWGAYSTLLRRPPPTRRGWGGAGEGTIADYLAVREGDLVFFFHERFIYGLGVVERFRGAGRAALCNYPRAWDLQVACEGGWLWEREPAAHGLGNHPFVLFFRPQPHWWQGGIDMDEALAADAHGYVSMLPFFWGLSFARLDDFETAHLAALVTRAGEGAAAFPDEHRSCHGEVQRRLDTCPGAYDIDVDALVRQHAAAGQVRHEALLEAWLVDAMVNRWWLVKECFGRQTAWSFVGRQVPASPFKPAAWVDRIDLLAYDIAPPVEGTRVPVARAYFAAELKRGAASAEDVVQAMKYVDWLAHRRQGGDYVGLRAAVVAAEFPREVREIARREAVRRYVRPRRPYGTSEWRNLRLIRYRVRPAGPALSLEPVDY